MIKNSKKWSKIQKNDQKFKKMIKNSKNDQKFKKMTKNSKKWSKIQKNDQKFKKMINMWHKMKKKFEKKIENKKINKWSRIKKWLKIQKMIKKSFKKCSTFDKKWITNLKKTKNTKFVSQMIYKIFPIFFDQKFLVS